MASQQTPSPPTGAACSTISAPSARAAPTSQDAAAAVEAELSVVPPGPTRLSEAHLADGRAAALAQLDAGGGRTLREAAAV